MTYVVLLLFFHSLILPLKAILMNVIAIVASYGVLVLVFQHGVGEGILGFEHVDRLSMFSPVILFSILFGLSTDYEVFLLSRVKELYAHSGNNEHSVAMGLEHTAGIITAAGLIMIVVFGSFALGSTLVIKELGVGLAVAARFHNHLRHDGPGQHEADDERSADAEIPRLDPADQGDRRTGRTWRGPDADFPSLPRLPPSDAVHCAVLRPLAVAAAPAGAPRETRIQPAARRSESGVRRAPVMLSDGHQQRRAGSVLRQCHVEDDPGRDGILSPVYTAWNVHALALQTGDRILG